VEGLKSAPAIKLKCGHIFHYQCILKQVLSLLASFSVIYPQVSSKWSSANITFGFMDCPLCNTEVEHDTLIEVMKPMKELKEIIKDRALKRLHYLKEENAKEIVEKGTHCDFNFLQRSC
jgi:E3 ubiquitin-protein ligase MYCBP2